MAVIQAPELPARKIYKHPFLVRAGYALSMAMIAMLPIGLIGLYLNIPDLMLITFGSFSFIITFVLSFWLDHTQPTQTFEEIWFRNRLEAARGRDRRVAQLNYDYDLLDRAANDLYETLGREEFIKQIKDPQIVEHAVEMARIGFKQEKINKEWAVTEH